jgi:hypothetical protein
MCRYIERDIERKVGKGEIPDQLYIAGLMKGWEFVAVCYSLLQFLATVTFVKWLLERVDGAMLHLLHLLQ